jgi:hypothetical protein
MAQMIAVSCPSGVATKVYNGGVTTGNYVVSATALGGLGMTSGVTIDETGRVAGGVPLSDRVTMTPNLAGLLGSIPALWFYHQAGQNETFYIWVA